MLAFVGDWNIIRVPLRPLEYELLSIERGELSWQGNGADKINYRLAPFIEKLLDECGLTTRAELKETKGGRGLVIATPDHRSARWFVQRLRHFSTLITVPLARGEAIVQFLSENCVGDYQPCGMVRDQRGVIYLSDEQDAHLVKLALHTGKSPIEVRESGGANWAVSF